MARTLTCDFCRTTVDLEKHTSTPYGWGKLKIDSRVSGNIGGMMMKLDICPQCNRGKELFAVKAKAVKFLKEIMSLEDKGEEDKRADHSGAETSERDHASASRTDLPF